MSWYTFTIIAMLCYGTQHFFFKMSAEKKCNTAWMTFSMMATVMVLSTFFFFITKQIVDKLPLLILLAVINAVVFFIQIISKVESLKHIATSVSYPISRMSVILVVLISMFYYKETITILQATGIIIGILVIILLSKEGKNKSKNFKIGITLALITLMMRAASTITSKVAAMHFNLLAVIAISYAFSTIFSLGIYKHLKGNKKDAIKIGIFAGIANLSGFYLLLTALKTGPLSIIAPLLNIAFVIPIILSAIIYKEKLTKKRIIGVLLAIIAVVILGITPTQ